MEIERMKLSELKADPENVRRHGSENVRMLEESLRRNEQYRPLVVDAKTRVVKIGNGRLEAMRRLEV